MIEDEFSDRPTSHLITTITTLLQCFPSGCTITAVARCFFFILDELELERDT